MALGPVFEENVDILIDDLKLNQEGKPVPIQTLKTRAKRDQDIIYEILENLKLFYEYSVQSDWTQLDISAPDFIKNKPIIGGGTTSNVLIDCGTILAPNENILIDCGSII